MWKSAINLPWYLYHFPALYRDFCTQLIIPQGLAEDICFLPPFKSISIFSIHVCWIYNNTMQETTDSSSNSPCFPCSDCFIRFTGCVWNGTALCDLNCWSLLYRKMFYWLLRLSFSEHPSGTWDCWFGAFVLELCYHICLTFCPWHSEIRFVFSKMSFIHPLFSMCLITDTFIVQFHQAPVLPLTQHSTAK